MTVDLTSRSVPPKVNHKRKTPQQTTDAGQDQPGETTPRLQARDDASDESSPNNRDERTTEVSPERTGHIAEDNKIQILGLHSANPVISYQNHVYSCSWASNIGTDLLFTAPGLEDSQPVLWSTSTYSLLAASSMRLMSNPTQLVFRQASESKEQQLADVTETALAAINDSTRIPVGVGASLTRHRQARFLEQMMELKRRNGEGDDVTVYAKRPKGQTRQAGPGQRRAGRKRVASRPQDETSAEGFETEDDVATRVATAIESEARATANRVDRPRSKGRPRGRGTGSQTKPDKTIPKKMFDWSETNGDSANCEQARESTILEEITPESWDDLEVPGTTTTGD